MKIIDTHAHYDDRWFDEDRYEVLDRILSDNVLAIINMSVDIPTCEFSLKLTERYENVFCAVGIHPENIADTPDNYIDILRTLAKNKKAVAIGEIGLDYHYDGYDAERQQEIFENQIKLANELSTREICGALLFRKSGNSKGAFKARRIYQLYRRADI